MPGAVIEPLYITDAFEGSIANSTDGQMVIARGIATAVEQDLPTPAPRARRQPGHASRTLWASERSALGRALTSGSSDRRR
jgi:hypothetical protein